MNKHTKIAFIFFAALISIFESRVLAAGEYPPFQIEPSEETKASPYYCSSILLRVAAPYLQPSDTLLVGTISELESQLAQTDFSEKDRKHIVQTIDKLLQTPTAHEPMARTTFELKRSERNQDLFICTPKFCAADEGGQDAYYLNVPSNFEMIPQPLIRNKTIQKIGKAIQEIQKETGPAGLMNELAILLTSNRPLETKWDSDHWISHFFHGASEYASERLLSQWIKANETLIAHGKKTDDLFSENVILTPTRALISVDFFHLFIKSRAYSVSAHVYRTLYPNLAKRMETYARETALEELQDRGISLGGDNITVITEANVFELGARMTERMEKTMGRVAGIAQGGL